MSSKNSILKNEVYSKSLHLSKHSCLLFIVAIKDILLCRKLNRTWWISLNTVSLF